MLPEQQLSPEWVTWESPGPTSDLWWSGGQEKVVDWSIGQHQQQVWWATGWGGDVGATKQQVLDKAIAAWQARVDQAGNIISSAWKNLWNISSINLWSNANVKPPQANAALDQQVNQNKVQEAIEQAKINSIKDDVSLGLTSSPDSPYRNKFGNAAVDTENQLPWFMNERNKVIASSLMLNTASMKYMSEDQRKEMILKDIIDRQEWGIDPAMTGRYENTINNVNNIINKSIPAPTANDYFGMILSWEINNIDYNIQKNNPTIAAAKRRYNDLQTYSSMDATSLSDAIITWDLNKWWQLWNDLVNAGMWPILNNAYGMYQTSIENKVHKYFSWELSEFDPDLSLDSQASQQIDLGTWLEWILSNKILGLITDDQVTTLAAWLADDTDVQRAKIAARATESEINKLSDTITEFADDIKTKVVERGGEATDDPFLNSYIEEKKKPFIKTLSTLNSKYRNEIAMLKDFTDTATAAFESAEYSKKSKMAGYQYLLERLDAQKAAAADAQEAALKQSNREREFALKSQPNMEVIGKDENGDSIYWYRDDTTKSRKQSDNMWGGDPTVTASWYRFSPVGADLIDAGLKQVQAQWDWSEWWQCGTFVNNYLSDIGLWRLFGNSYEQKKWLVNSKTPTIWSIAIMPSITKWENGHVGVVVWLNNDGTVKLKQSNKAGEEKVFTSNVKLSSIEWFFDPSGWKTATSNGMNDARSDITSKLLGGIAQRSDLTSADMKKKLWTNNMTTIEAKTQTMKDMIDVWGATPQTYDAILRSFWETYETIDLTAKTIRNTWGNDSMRDAVSFAVDKIPVDEEDMDPKDGNFKYLLNTLNDVLKWYTPNEDRFLAKLKEAGYSRSARNEIMNQIKVLPNVKK